MYTIEEIKTIEKARYIIENKYFTKGDPITDTTASKEYIQLRIGHLDHEIFMVIYLDNRHNIIEIEEMFRGTVDKATVHPREVLKNALQHNASAIIIAHNHPSGDTEPSRADIEITKRLKEGLNFVEIRLLDHIIVGSGEGYSFAERGTLP